MQADDQALADVIAATVAEAVKPYAARIAALEAREPVHGKDGRDGKDATPIDVDLMVSRLMTAIPHPVNGKDGRDGKDAEPVDLDAIVLKVLELVPPPAKGEKGDPGESIKGDPGRDGKDAEPVDVPAIVRQVVELMPSPQKGDQGLPGAPGRDGKDGVGVAGAVIDRGGNLILTLSDGTTKELGMVQGQKGEPGTNGTDGKDGLGFEDMDFIEDTFGRVSAEFRRGDVVKTARLFSIVDRDVWKAGETYEKGDGVTLGGSFWIARRQTTARPETTDDWRLAVKRGRDGRHGKDGAQGPQGKQGPQGDKGTAW